MIWPVRLNPVFGIVEKNGIIGVVLISLLKLSTYQNFDICY